MKKLGWLLSTLAVLTAGTGLKAMADDTPEIKPMFEDGKFKCSDGYDPDTDPSLHPPGQSPQARAQVNAQAQAEHEKSVANKEPDQAPGSGGGKQDKKKSSDDKVDDKKESDKKDEDKKDDEKKDEDKKDDKDKKDKDKDKKDKDKDKDSDKKDKNKDKSSSESSESKAAKNPLNQAIFAIQTKNYQSSISLLKTILEKSPKNAQAHYLLAVSYVGLRKYTDAAGEYETVLKNTSDPKLSELAKQGLQRVSSSKK